MAFNFALILRPYFCDSCVITHRKQWNGLLRVESSAFSDLVLFQIRAKDGGESPPFFIPPVTTRLATSFLVSHLLPSFHAPDLPAAPGMANVRIIRSFTKSERQRLELIQSIYRECVSAKELPIQLRLEKKKPVRPPSLSKYTFLNAPFE